MTCIAAIIDRDGVGHIASDSVGADDSTKSMYVNRKVFTVGDMLFGWCGSYRMGQILQYRLMLPTATVDQDLDHWLHVDFVDAVRNVLKENGFLRVENNAEAAGTFLIVVAGRIFTMQGDLSLLESSDCFESVGSGEDYARATMNCLVDYIDDPAVILTKAIEAATKYVPSVGGDIHMLSEEVQQSATTGEP